MKNIYIKICYTLLLLVGVLFFNSCSDDAIQEDGIRLFRPVLNVPLYAEKNAIIVKMALFKTAVAYKVELSRDNFATPAIKTIETSDPTVIIPNLLWNTAYQVRATAYASDPQFNSKVAELGEVKTERFPSILAIPQTEDIIDNGLNVRWTVSGSPVTTVKIFAAADEELANELASYTTTEAQQLAGLRSVKQLAAETSYTVAIYSDGVLRGFEIFTTKPALPTEGNILDLRGDDMFDPLTDDGSYLKAKLDEAQTQPTTVILDGDQTYILNGYALTNSIKIISGYSLTSGGAVIDVKNNFNTATGTSAIGSIVFDGIKIKGQGRGANYLFAPTTDFVIISEWKFINCTVSDFRGMFRLRGGNGGEITNFVMDKCDVSQIGGYYVLNTDNAAWDFKNATFTNSTFHQIERFLNNKHSGSNFNVTIDSCTFFEVTLAGGNPFLSVAGGAKLANLTVSNTVIGHGFDTSGAVPPNYAITFISDPTSVLISSFNNVYDTADAAYVAGKAPSDLGATVIRYSGTSTDLFTDPSNNVFTYKDNTFAGKSSVGDPRWIL